VNKGLDAINLNDVSIMSQFETVSYPKIRQRPDGRIEVIITYQGKRMRLQNGSTFGVALKPNSFPLNERLSQAKILAAQVYRRLITGFDPYDNARVNSIEKLSDTKIIKRVLEAKKDKGISKHYYTQLEYSFRMLKKRLKGGEITPMAIEQLLSEYSCPTSYNNIRRNLLVLFNEANEIGWEKKPMKGIRPKRAKAKLNKPIDDVSVLLKEIRSYNENLYLCCLLTYGCLLRPHREIRELTWSDFTEDLSYIRLSGDRNKSGRNRIVPVPYYVKKVLNKREDHLNIFSGKEESFAPDYFKGLWRRFKKRSKFLEENQTLYSFRHTGAIDVYKRTGSIEKLKAAMGHSNIMVSLTYLRGLDVAELKEEDMPMISFNSTKSSLQNSI